MTENRLDVRCAFQIHAHVLIPENIPVAQIPEDMLKGLQEDFNKGLIDLLMEEFDKEADMLELHSITGETLIERIEENNDTDTAAV